VLRQADFELSKIPLSPKFVVWWNIAWVILIGALAPVVNYLTPFLDPSYNNYWTPDIFWRLVLYYHGAFIPWMMVLAALVIVTFRLDSLKGKLGGHLQHLVLIGGLFSGPLAALGGFFDIYNRFAFGIPAWTQIVSIGIGGETVAFLIFSMLYFPKGSNSKYRDLGLPFFVVLLSAVGVLIAALMGDVSGWITWFGPWPSIFPQYINATMYPVLGFYNDTAVITWTEGAVTGHSHLMLISVMAGIVALTPAVFGYAKWARREKILCTAGFLVMIVGLVGSIWIYIISGVGNFAPPTLFQSGPNGLASDDATTGIVALGALFVLLGLVMYASRGKTKDGRTLIRDPMFLALVTAWILIYIVIPITGIYIEFNESFYQTTGLPFDQAFTRFHQDFAFFLLPALVTSILVFEMFNVTGKTRRTVGFLYLVGSIVTFIFGYTYAMVTLDFLSLTLAAFGGVLMGLGVLIGAEHLRKTGNWAAT